MPTSRLLKAPKTNFGNLLLKKKNFLIKVYLTIAVQLLVTYIVVFMLRKYDTINQKIHKFWILWFILTLALLFGILYNKLPIAVRLLCYFIFSILIGFNCIATIKYISRDSIKLGLIGTFCIFIIMTLIAFILAALGVNLSFLSFVLSACLSALLIAGIIMIFIPTSSFARKIYFAAGLILFSIFIAFDTNTMIQPDYIWKDDYINASVGIYLDIMNVFTDIVGFDNS